MHLHYHETCFRSCLNMSSIINSYLPDSSNLELFQTEIQKGDGTYPAQTLHVSSILIIPRVLCTLYPAKLCQLWLKNRWNILFWYCYDIFIGGLAQSLHLTLTYLFNFTHRNYARDCGVYMHSHNSKSFKNLVACHGAETVGEQKALWNEFCYSSTNNDEKAKTVLNYC